VPCFYIYFKAFLKQVGKTRNKQHHLKLLNSCDNKYTVRILSGEQGLLDN